ncbi:hypothetical protein DFP72DRAFT_903071 [Ephemerocybe angulata]|uniref:RRM domain-containing protein n=1 Tax=Ephemerocybe angulata TaxID=980116 RepID=A0A8H6HUS2_9AGAR|nr:hypothetical protein DFP72DRAFT_903071 [Tulosesus angulatus]
MPDDHERFSHREERYRPRHDDAGGHRVDRDREHRGGDRGDRYGDRDRGGRGGDDRRDRYRDDRPHGRHDEDRRGHDRRRRGGDDEHRGRHDDGRGDRRRGGGGGGGGGGGRRGEGTPDRRSPTPEGIPPLSQRKRKASGWDVHAPGYEQYTALQAKQTGLFNLPGANRTQIPPILGIAGLPPPGSCAYSRRLYIGSITPDKMIEMNIGTGAPGNPVLAVQCNYEKNYAFVEFRSAEDATAAMAFDGIIFINGPLKIRRPKDYGGENLPASPGVHVPGIVMELLKSFGELKAFNLVRENGNGPSKGFAFFDLNQMELGDRYLVVQRASVGAKSDGQGMIPNLPYDQFPEIPRPIMPAGQEITDARILLMLNMVTAEDLIEDGEYGDLYEDVKEETSKYGEVEDLRIPRPAKKDKAKWGESQLTAAEAARVDEAAGVGRVYGSNNALNSLAGRSFAGRSIIATLLSEESQTTPPLNIIFAPAPEAPPPLPMEL